MGEARFRTTCEGVLSHDSRICGIRLGSNQPYCIALTLQNASRCQPFAHIENATQLSFEECESQVSLMRAVSRNDAVLCEDMTYDPVRRICRSVIARDSRTCADQKLRWCRAQSANAREN